MKAAGIIAEYNPFHNGHRYQIDELRARTGTDYVIIAMSGDFVQRGEPAIYDKYTRTRMALSAGADLVLELPVAFATSSAADFASCGAALLDRIGIVDTLCFGSECGDTAPMKQIAQLLLKEPAEYTNFLKKRLRTGDSYPKAREYAVREWFTQNGNGSSAEEAGLTASLLSSPNNILGIEYMKALLQRNSRIQPYTVQRCGKGYHDTVLAADDMGKEFASASAIRKAIHQELSDYAGRQMPILPDSSAVPVCPDDLSTLFNYRLLELSHSKQSLTAFADVSFELADRIQNQLLQFASFSERIGGLKTRQYTYTRISRALLHILLGITDSQIEEARRQDYTAYARILGFKRDAAPLLTQMKEKSAIPLITKTAAAADLLSGKAREMFEQDVHCSHIYQAIVQQKSGILPRNEYTHSVVIL